MTAKPAPKAQADSEGAAPLWRVTAASATGASHLRSARGNDDAYLCASSPSGTLLLAAADGAGSARQAAAGAKLAVRVAVESLCRLEVEPGSWPSRVAVAVSRVRRQLDALATREQGELRDYACTLLLLLATDSQLLGCQIGDGAIVVRRHGLLERVTRPQHGRYAGETLFATGAEALRGASLTEAALEGVDALALFTDGLEPVALTGETPFAPFFEPLFGFAADADRGALERGRALEGFLTSERVRSRTDDDLTLLLATHR